MKTENDRIAAERQLFGLKYLYQIFNNSGRLDELSSDRNAFMAENLEALGLNKAEAQKIIIEMNDFASQYTDLSPEDLETVHSAFGTQRIMPEEKLPQFKP